MCSGPVSVITELGPSTAAIGVSPVAEGATSGGAVSSSFTAAGSLTIVSCRPLGAKVIVNASPQRLAQKSINAVGASAHASVCAIAGRGTRRGKRPGGEPPRSIG
jgi:hypothetical protein